jgi:hypothetical protein
MSDFFEFEADFVQSLRCIPMQVRFKLDTCGVKLKLDQWSKFNAADRQALVDRPCADPETIQAYHNWLCKLINERTGQTATNLAIAPDPDWEKLDVIPTTVTVHATEVGINLTTEQWQELRPLERFALIKLSRSSHEHNNFRPALQEFGIAAKNCQ